MPYVGLPLDMCYALSTVVLGHVKEKLAIPHAKNFIGTHCKKKQDEGEEDNEIGDNIWGLSNVWSLKSGVSKVFA